MGNSAQVVGTQAPGVEPAVAPRWRTWLRRGAIGLAGLLAILLAAAWVFGARRAEGYALGLLDDGPYPVDADDRELYDAGPKVDLHADTLLWPRDLIGGHPRGHIDLPRLLEADMTVQVFGIVSQSTFGQNYDSTPDEDGMGLLAFMNHWPIGTWGSVPQRALYQADVLHETADRSDGQLIVIHTRQDLEEVLRRRSAGEQVVGGLLGLEGLQVLEHELDNLDRMFEAGIRMGGLAHFFDNEASGSLSGVEKHGLTELGRRAVRRMEELGMVVDLAHASPAAVVDALEIVTRPVVVSHTGVKATCPGNRNLSDDQVRAIADNGGVIGIGFWEGAVCGTAPADIARAIAHVVDLVGAEHAALGSDFDGGTTTSFDVTGFPLLVSAMRDAGLRDDEIQMVLGQNALRVLLEVLPSNGSDDDD